MSSQKLQSGIVEHAVKCLCRAAAQSSPCIEVQQTLAVRPPIRSGQLHNAGA
jgi:hypothetical protein